MTKIRRCIGLGVLSVIALTSAGHAGPTWCGSCVDVFAIYCSGFFSEHSFGGAGPYDGWEGYHDNWACGTCPDGHIRCYVASAAHEAAILALKSGEDIDKVASTYSDYVLVDHTAMRVRLKDCDGTVVATLPMPPSAEVEIAD